MITDKDIIQNLNFMCRTYDGLTRMITSTKNRLHSLSPETDQATYWLLKGEIENKAGTIHKHQGMENLKGQVARRIEKELDFWPVWSQWLKNVPGIGPNIGGNLVLMYYYSFKPACPDCNTLLSKQDGTFWCTVCEKSVKGEGNLTFDLQFKDFPMISSWWHYMGRHVVDGKVPKRAKGVVMDWNNKGRQIGYQIGQSFVKQPTTHKYRQEYDKRKAAKDKTHPEASKMHKHNMALNETIKLFLSHFWQVARTIDDLPVTEPYIVAKNPLHKTIPPYYWEGKLKKAA